MTTQTPSLEDGAKYTVDAVDKAVTVLMTVAHQPDLGLSEIARRSGESKARTFRLLRTLEARGMVICAEDDRTYRLGYTALVLGGRAERQIDLVKRAQPFLVKLGQQVEETTQLRIRDGHQTVCIAAWEPARELRVHAYIGRRRWMYAGCSRVFLAFSDPELQEFVLSQPLAKLTARTITDPAVLRARLADIRRDSVGVSRGEVSDDLVSITAPVFGANKGIVATINVGAPASRMQDQETIERGVEAVKAAAKELSISLGWTGSAAMTGRYPEAGRFTAA